MISLIDGDVLLYRIGHTTISDTETIAKIRIDDLVDSILLETDATAYELWLSDNKEGNFRFHICPEYKANRVAPRPLHYECLKEHLVKEWGARIALGMEADDALGIGQAKAGELTMVGTPYPPTVICSIDKDLLQVSGKHYNFVRKEWYTVTEWEGLQWFYKQILIGDTSDNVKGCDGVGPVKAGKAINPITSSQGEEALLKKVIEVYEKHEIHATRQEILDHILLVGQLLKIKTKEGEQNWHFPSSNLTVEQTLLSTPPKQVGTIPSTEPTTQVATSG